MKIPLLFIGWYYDDVADVLVARFADLPPEDDADPVRYIPQRVVDVQLKPMKVTIDRRPTPTPVPTPPVDVPVEPPVEPPAPPTPRGPINRGTSDGLLSD